MSQEQPNQPKPEKQTPPTPTPKTVTAKSGTGFQKVTQTLQETWKRTQPVVQTKSINALRGTIKLLQGTVKKLEAQPPPAPQPPTFTSPSAATLPPETPASTQPSTITAAPEATPTLPPTQAKAPRLQPVPQKQSFWTILGVLFANLPVWWKAALGKIRTRLPESVNQKLPNDTLLTGAIAALFIFLFWATSVLSPGKPPQIASVPPASPTAPTEVTLPPEVIVPPEAIASPEIVVPPGVQAPPELTAPSSPKPVATISPPPPVLTPEQNLIAAIQNQVAQITSQYADGLIQAIQANFPGSLLTVKVSDDWYTFDSSKQDNLATDMWHRAQKLDFRKLEISDSQGSLVARTPVVGSNMVILKRALVLNDGNKETDSLNEESPA